MQQISNVHSKLPLESLGAKIYWIVYKWNYMDSYSQKNEKILSIYHV
jgi:hypothetical protein